MSQTTACTGGVSLDDLTEACKAQAARHAPGFVYQIIRVRAGGVLLTPSHEEQSRRSLEDEKLSDETPSEGGLSSGLPRAGAAAVIADDRLLQLYELLGACASL